MKKIFIVVLFELLFISVKAQKNVAWKGKKCAVVLTYDDAIHQHLDNAIPVLDSLGLKASFYLTAFSDACKTRLNEWRALPKRGHELGNHTLFHPCLGNLPGRNWVKGEQDMSQYTYQRMLNEVRMTNVFLEALDGQKKRTFAFTCGDMKIGDKNFIDDLKTDFVAARAVRDDMHTIDKVNLYDVDCYVVNNHTAEQMIAWVEKAKANNALLVILFHGVGGGNGLDVKIEEHRKFLKYLKQNQKDIMIETMLDTAEYIKAFQAK